MFPSVEMGLIQSVIPWVVMETEGDEACRASSPCPARVRAQGVAAGWGHTKESDMGPAHHPCSLRAPGKSQGRFHPKSGVSGSRVLYLRSEPG